MTALATDLRARVEAIPGMDRLLPALAGLAPCYLVGGAVRDLLRGERGIDLDLAVEGDARAVAGELARRLGGAAVGHERFGTATVRADGLALDLATTRRERYRVPGGLPEVEPAPLADDLGRRDFSINAMAVALAGEEVGRLHDPHGGRRDLEAGVIRVLHRRSFVDDPTRLLRAVRYEARLDFAMEPDTDALARAAAADGAFATVSGARVGDELLDLLAEPSAPAALGRLVALGLDRALHPALAVDPRLAARAAAVAPETEADPALAVLATLLLDRPDALAPWVESLGVGADARDRALRAARSAPGLAGAVGAAPRPSQLRRLLDPEPPEALAVALALGAQPEAIGRYLRELRHVGLEISGTDLVRAGIPESPAIGRALAEVLDRKLDGEVAGPEGELRLALAHAAEGQRR